MEFTQPDVKPRAMQTKLAALLALAHPREGAQVGKRMLHIGPLNAGLVLVVRMIVLTLDKLGQVTDLCQPLANEVTTAQAGLPGSPRPKYHHTGHAP
jgi:hypothetical protein